MTRDRGPEPFVTAYAPARWPSPDDTREGIVARAWLPDDVTVGYLVLQDDALAFYSTAGPDDPAAYGVRSIVRDIMAKYLAYGASALDAWDAANTAALFEAAERIPLAPFFEELRTQWGTS